MLKMADGNMYFSFGYNYSSTTLTNTLNYTFLLLVFVHQFSGILVTVYTKRDEMANPTRGKKFVSPINSVL